MGSAYFFQRYHTRENMHSSNALLLLKRTYFYSPKIFYKLLSSLLGLEGVEFLPVFSTQDKGEKSVPDFCISQNGFKIIVEAKEKYNYFNEEQMRRHLNGLSNEHQGYKIFIALAPKFSESDRCVFDRIESVDIKFIRLTYLDLYMEIRELCNDAKDEELVEILDEYRDYCNDENLIDDTDNTIMVRQAGTTLDFNVQPDINIYYDNAEHRYEGFRYLGLYNKKQIRYVGKITKIIKAYLLGNVPQMEVLYPHKEKLTEDDRQRVNRAMENQKKLYDNITIPHCYFLVEKFVEVENFRKASKMALYGRKKFYLNQFGLKPNCSAIEIAEKMKNKTWEEVEEKN